MLLQGSIKDETPNGTWQWISGRKLFVEINSSVNNTCTSCLLEGNGNFSCDCGYTSSGECIGMCASAHRRHCPTWRRVVPESRQRGTFKLATTGLGIARPTYVPSLQTHYRNRALSGPARSDNAFKQAYQQSSSAAWLDSGSVHHSI